MDLVSGRSVVEGVLVDWAVARPAELPTLPVGLLSRAEVADELGRVQAQRAMLAAYEAELVLALAAEATDADDPPPGSPGAGTGSWSARDGLPGVSQFFPDELALVLNCGKGSAAHLSARAWTWRVNLPATLAALRSGTLDEPRAKVLAEVCEHATPEAAAAVEDRLLPEATNLSLRALRRRATELLLELDAAAVEQRRAKARRSADVHTYPSPLDGMATLAAELPAEEAAAAYDLVDQLAQMRKADGDPRPIGQLRTVVFSELLRRPWEPGAGVLARLEIRATLGALDGSTGEAGQVNGLPITAGHLRELLTRLGALGLRAPDSGTLAFALTDGNGRLLATLSPQELARLARRGCPDHPQDDCRCGLVGVPPATDAYPPTDRQRTFVTTRDRRCRFPNCGQRTGWADLDHVVPHACGGQTACENLCCLCRSHHRLKTFARGWQFRMDPDGTLHVTTPSGITRTTRPPGLRPPPAAEPEPSAEPAPRVEPDDDPPPF
jgi:hypothetical protein